MITTTTLIRSLCGICRVVVGGVLLWSGLQKMNVPADFLAAVYRYELVGPTLGLAIAVGLPALEVVLGIALVVGVGVGGALMLTGALLVLFLSVQVSALVRGLGIPCGCTGTVSTDEVIGFQTLIRTAVLLLVAGGGYAAWIVSVKSTP